MGSGLSGNLHCSNTVMRSLTVLGALAVRNGMILSQTFLSFHGPSDAYTGNGFCLVTIADLYLPQLGFQRVSQLCPLHGQDQWESLRLTLCLGY